MRKAPKVMPRTAASPSPRSAGGQGCQHHHAAGGGPLPIPGPLPCPKLTVGRPPAILHRHFQDPLEDGGVL